MTIWFDRPIGAHADVNELEYIAALHQSCMPDLRVDGSIHAEDIVNYLVSRHGIRTTEEVVNDEILNNLAGNLDSQQPPILDIAEVASILLIPHLKRAADENQTDFFNRLYFLFQTNIPLDDNTHKTNEDGELLLTPALVQTFLESQGEFDVPPQVIQEMIAHAAAAVAGNGGDTLVEQEDEEDIVVKTTKKPHGSVAFTVETLTHALTCDLGPYDPTLEAKWTTHVQDVLATVEKGKEAEESNGDLPTSKSTYDARLDTFKRIFTAASIDHGADTFASPTWVILVWVLMVILYLVYVSGVTSASFASLDCNTHLRPFGCNVVNGLITWSVIFLQLTILGVSFVVVTSLGNSIYDSSNKLVVVARTLIAILTIFVTCIASFFIPIKTFFFDTTRRPGYEAAYYGGMFMALMLIYIQIMELLRGALGKQFLERHPRLQRYLTPGNIRKESNLKAAAAFKVNRMINNALEVHNAPSLIGSRASMSVSNKNPMYQFQLLVNRRESVGGILWAWKRIWDGSIGREEGVWLHARLIACNTAQMFVTIFILVLWTLFLRLVREQHNKSEFKIPVTKAEVDAALSLGAIAAIVACSGITIVFLPSFISTCLQFRSGVIPSLHSKSFLIYRFAEDNATVLFGSCFWGMWSTGFVCWALVGLIAFFLVWHVTRTIVIYIISNILGLVITLIVKLGILMILRHTLYRGFYRKHPAFANIVSLTLECWNLGLSTGYMLARTAQLLLVTALYLGRLDTPVLAPGVGMIGPMALDAYPITFRKDLLLHDAHRHPFIERLGMMYLMKLLHGDAFANRPGSCWRVLLVLVLMPWLRKYRIPSIEELKDQVPDEPDDDDKGGDKSNVVNDDDDEDIELQQLKKQHQQEKLEHYQKTMQDAGITSDDDRESILQREVQILRKRNHLQQKEIEQLRELLSKKEQDDNQTPVATTTNNQANKEE